MNLPGTAEDAELATRDKKLSDVTGVQWNAFFAAFLGWLLDGFDFSVLTFLLLDIEHSFTVDRALAGALGTVTLMFRLVGGSAGGTIADRFGRKTPLILSILWISLFSLLSGFSSTYLMLFACRALFGIGMGGVWASGLPLALEHWPKNLRGVASGLLVGGFAWGYILAAFAFTIVSRLASHYAFVEWRVLFWAAATPVLFVFWIKSRVKESPVWLAQQLDPLARKQGGRLSIIRIFEHDLIGTTLQTSIIMSAFMFSYYSMTFWYPTFVRELKLSPLQFVVALNGGILGMAFWGRIAETRLGRRGAVTVAIVLAVLLIPLFLNGRHNWMLAGAIAMGLCGIGAWGMAPLYLAERFPTSARAVGSGSGFAYHAGAAIGSLTPAFIGLLQDRGVALPRAMALCIAIASLLVAALIWLGPETRGKSFTATES